ncbi:MAG: adenylyltransferase/cytidyltransferase family protein [Pseudonocardia sp.]
MNGRAAGTAELACVTGRFQPVHLQHVELFEIALRRADHLVVAVTNPDAGARHVESTSNHRHRGCANPFTFYERVRLLTAALGGLADRVSVVPFDLTRPEHWPEYVPLHARQVVRAYGAWERHKARLLADAGYPVEVLDGDPAGRLSSSDVRARLAAGAVWEELVPAAVVPVLRALQPAVRP